MTRNRALVGITIVLAFFAADAILLRWPPAFIVPAAIILSATAVATYAQRLRR